MHTIRDVATHFNITYDALRFYEKKGLLNSIHRNANGQREYSDQDLDDLDKIIHLRQLGATIEEIKHMSALLDPDNRTVNAYDEGITLLNRLKRETDEKIKQLQQQQVYLDHKVARFKKERDQLESAPQVHASTN
ncbi:MerR family transcriptional regulator [Furfurilactobacillus cerevisiae]|uniref:MerR family transcriptional regulator n=1 Tax=Furfurilactobacillus rossiae TaxID=231049 RepID=UPI003B98734C